MDWEDFVDESIYCCFRYPPLSLKKAGLDMLETTLVALQDIMLHKILDDAGQKVLLSEFSKIMQLRRG
ncbi:hypothetical protein ACET3Z_004954 [Daucus carota]